MHNLPYVRDALDWRYTLNGGTMNAQRLLFALALAGTAGISLDAQAEPEDWAQVYRNARTVSYVSPAMVPLAVGGGIGGAMLVMDHLDTGGTGAQDCLSSCVAAMVGVAVGVGIFGTLIPSGPAMLAGSSLRARRAVNELGGERVDSWAGYTAWSLLGLSAASILTFPAFEDGPQIPIVISSVLYASSWAFGIVQWQKNAAAWRALPDDPTASRRRAVNIPLLSISGRF